MIKKTKTIFITEDTLPGSSAEVEDICTVLIKEEDVKMESTEVKSK